MTTDPTPLQERLWEAVAEVRDQHPRVFNDAPTDDVVAAVLPHIATEVRKAQADAWDEGQASGWDEAQEQWQINGTVGDAWKHADTHNPYREQEH